MCRQLFQMWSFIFILIVNGERVKSNRNIFLTVGESHYNKDYFENFTFRINNGKVFLDMALNKPLLRGWRARLDFRLRVRNSMSFQSMFSTTVDVCTIVNAYKNNLFKKWYNNLLKYGNFLRNCPLNASYYYLRGWQFDNKLFPPFLMSGSYRLETYNFYGKYRGNNEVFIMSCSADATITD